MVVDQNYFHEETVGVSCKRPPRVKHNLLMSPESSVQL